MYKLCLLSIILLSILSCKKEEDKTDENKVLYDKIGGAYLMVNASSDIPIDANQDGRKSTNMIEEIQNLNNSYVYLTISTNGKFMSLQWPEQRVKDNIPRANWDMPVLSFRLDFNDENNEILIKNSDYYGKENTWYPLQQAFVQGNAVNLKMRRHIVTPTGEQEVIINASYEKDPKFLEPYH